MGEPEGKRLLGRPKLRSKYDIRWIFRKCDRGMEWIDLAQDRDSWRTLVSVVMNRPVP